MIFLIKFPHFSLLIAIKDVHATIAFRYEGPNASNIVLRNPATNKPRKLYCIIQYVHVDITQAVPALYRPLKVIEGYGDTLPK